MATNKRFARRAGFYFGLPVTSACGGYDGWIGDFIEERRLNGLSQITRILEALAEVGGKGIVVPAAWGMFTFRLPPMKSPRSLAGDRKAVSDSLRYLDEVAARTGTTVFLEPLSDDSILFESTAGQMVMTQALESGNGRSESGHSCNPASSYSSTRFYKRVWLVSSIST